MCSRHDIANILLKSALNTTQSINEFQMTLHAAVLENKSKM